MPGTVLVAGDTALNKMERNPVLTRQTLVWNNRC